MLFHPGPAKIDCGECAKFIFDLETGQKKTWWGRDKETGERQELPCIRPENVPTPCDKCPKQSPEKAKEHELSEKNRQAVNHWLESRAVGISEAERGDGIVRKNFAILDVIWREYERDRQAKVNAAELAKLMPK